VCQRHGGTHLLLAPSDNVVPHRLVSVSALPSWYEETLAKQLGMNPTTWQTLQERGVTEESQLRLDFFFDAPGEREAATLAAALREETDYDVQVTSQKRAVLAKRTWHVTGATQPTAVTLEVLNNWVRWMVTAGATHGGCVFDGWGAKVG